MDETEDFHSMFETIDTEFDDLEGTKLLGETYIKDYGDDYAEFGSVSDNV